MHLVLQTDLNVKAQWGRMFCDYKTTKKLTTPSGASQLVTWLTRHSLKSCDELTVPMMVCLLLP